MYKTTLIHEYYHILGCDTMWNTGECKYLPDYTLSYTEIVHTIISFLNTLLKKRKKKEVTGRWGRRLKQILDDLEERRGYWKLKEETLYRTLLRTCFGSGYRLAVGQTTEQMNHHLENPTSLTLTQYFTSQNCERIQYCRRFHACYWGTVW